MSVKYNQKLIEVFKVTDGPGSSVGRATDYGLDGPGQNASGDGVHPASCTMGTGSFPGVKSGRGVKLTPHHLLVSWSRKSRAIPLLPLWAVRPVQSLSACTRVHFTFLYLIRNLGNRLNGDFRPSFGNLLQKLRF